VDAAKALHAAGLLAAQRPGRSPVSASATFGGRNAVPAAPVKPRGRGQVIVFALLGLVALALTIGGALWLAARKRRPVPGPPAPGQWATGPPAASQWAAAYGPPGYAPAAPGRADPYAQAGYPGQPYGEAGYPGYQGQGYPSRYPPAPGYPPPSPYPDPPARYAAPPSPASWPEGQPQAPVNYPAWTPDD
jgi:hypothetical protein